jgi:hypothetical protein
MRRLFTLIVLVLLAGCSAYVPPTVVSPTTTPAALPTAATTVVIRGNVYVRDNSGEVQGWLEAGTTVEAACSGEWCYITGGQFDGLKFWRGCSEDNPAGAGCTQAR